MNFLRVNMAEKKVVSETADESFTELGGRGLTAAIISKEVPPTCDPLGPDNKLVIACGLLTGTNFINTSRISIGGKSPLTGGIKESNAGGTIGAIVGKMGIKAIIVEGAPADDQLYILKIQKDGSADLLPAADLKGLRTYALLEKLTAQYGKKVAVLCIGPAGEYKLSSASIQSSDVDGHPCRAAGRGGMGAVMGAKGLKAIIVEMGDRVEPVIADPEAFKEATTAFVRAVKEDPSSGAMLPHLGTAGLVAPVNLVGGFPSYNATQGTLKDWEKISGETMMETINARGGKSTHMGCSQCIIHCSNVYVDENGGYVTSSLEYETIWSMGGMLGVNDLDAIAKLDYLCDDIGVDTMNTGAAIAVAMDAGYKSFSDSQVAIELVEEIAKGSELGKIIGNGPTAVGKHFNHTRVAAVKNQSIAAYDPRIMPANGVTYATSPMGADHTAGNLVGEYLTGKLDAQSNEGHVEASMGTQPVMAFVDCAGICLFAAFALVSPEGAGALFKAMGAKLGRPFGPEDMIEMGMNCIKMERNFNNKAGLTVADNRLPKFFKTEPLGPNNLVFKISDEELDSAVAS